MSILNEFVDFAHQNLLNHESAQSYLRKRGSNDIQWARHRVGFISDVFEFSKDCGSDCSCDACRFSLWLKGNSESDRFRQSDCIVYPLTSYSGEVYGIQTRNITYKRYDTFVLSNRPEALFFGCAANVLRIFNSSSVFLAEGPSDMLVIERCLNVPCLSILTNNLNRAQTSFIRRFATKVYCVLDMDEAGRNGVSSIRDALQDDLEVIDVKYGSRGQVKDPNEFWSQLGDLKFKTAILKEISR